MLNCRIASKETKIQREKMERPESRRNHAPSNYWQLGIEYTEETSCYGKGVAHKGDMESFQISER